MHAASRRLTVAATVTSHDVTSRDELAPTLAPVISVGSRDNLGRVERTIELDRRAIADAIGLSLAHVVREHAWWSPATFTGARRAGDAWRATHTLVVDVDHVEAHRNRNRRERGEEIAPGSDRAPYRDVLAMGRALRDARASWVHLTKRGGARLVCVLDRPITDRDVFHRAADAMIARARRWLAAHGLDRAYEIDAAASRDCARLWYAPPRSARIHGSGATFALGDLLADTIPVPESRAPRNGASSNAGHAVAGGDDARRRRAYVERALADEARELAATPEGKRNNTLNSIALRLFRLALPLESEGAIDGVWRELEAAALASGLGAAETRSTLDSALRAARRMGPPELADRPYERRSNGAADGEPPIPTEILPPPKIGGMLAGAIDRAERRARRIEYPVPLPFPMLEEHFGGGLWPGVHYLVASTGIGKTQLSLQMALYAARKNVPALYIGLELEEMQIGLRVVGEEAKIGWSTLYTGKAGPVLIDRARSVVPALEGLPLHVVPARPQGWPSVELPNVVGKLRELYPEPDGPGSRPLLVVLDFLQIIGDEIDANGRSVDLRERIGRAAYRCRDVASQFGVAVFVISSTARTGYSLLFSIAKDAGLTCTTDDRGRPIGRYVNFPDVLVGLGKESGEIEYSGDSVSVLARLILPSNDDEGGGFVLPSAVDGADMLFVTAKCRTGRPMWSPMYFDGHRYREADDGGSFVVERIKAAFEQKKTQKAKMREEARAKRDEERARREEERAKREEQRRTERATASCC
jgi:hypothetical protein